MYATHLVCKGCGSQHPLEARFACDRCFGPLEAAYDRAAIAAGVTRELIESGPSTLWRWESFLPVRAPGRGLPVGNSPLIRADRLAAELGLDCELYVKTETSNPTHSFKDRVVAVALAAAVDQASSAGCSTPLMSLRFSSAMSVKSQPVSSLCWVRRRTYSQLASIPSSGMFLSQPPNTGIQ